MKNAQQFADAFFTGGTILLRLTILLISAGAALSLVILGIARLTFLSVPGTAAEPWIMIVSGLALGIALVCWWADSREGKTTPEESRASRWNRSG